MQYQSPANDCLDQIEHCLAETEQTLQLQTATLRYLQGNLADTIRREGWYAIQLSEMMRLLVRDLRELRTVLIWSVVREGIISTDMLQTMLWAMPEDRRLCPPALQSLDEI